VAITEESRRAGEDPSLLARDGLHPSGKMDAQWADAALPVAAAALAEAGPAGQGTRRSSPLDFGTTNYGTTS
jgi:hypothetical protein